MQLISKVRALKPKGEEKPDLKKIREVANEVITQYKGLNEESKANLQETFPQITNVLKSKLSLYACARCASRLIVASAFRREVPVDRARPDQGEGGQLSALAPLLRAAAPLCRHAAV